MSAKTFVWELINISLFIKVHNTEDDIILTMHGSWLLCHYLSEKSSLNQVMDCGMKQNISFRITASWFTG